MNIGWRYANASHMFWPDNLQQRLKLGDDMQKIVEMRQEMDDLRLNNRRKYCGGLNVILTLKRTFSGYFENPFRPLTFHVVNLGVRECTKVDTNFQHIFRRKLKSYASPTRIEPHWASSMSVIRSRLDTRRILHERKPFGNHNQANDPVSHTKLHPKLFTIVVIEIRLTTATFRNNRKRLLKNDHDEILQSPSLPQCCNHLEWRDFNISFWNTNALIKHIFH